jgi:hypothetical protein
MVEGYLIGTKAKPNSTAEGAILLRSEIKKHPRAQWKVYDLGELLEQTKEAHQELSQIYEKAAKRASSDEG